MRFLIRYLEVSVRLSLWEPGNRGAGVTASHTPGRALLVLDSPSAVRRTEKVFVEFAESGIPIF